MDLVIRPTRSVNRIRTVGALALAAALFWMPCSNPWLATASGGETPSEPAQAPAASSVGSAPAKARVASVSREVKAHIEADSIARARQVISDCKTKYQSVQDYTCTFFKRERIDGKVYTPHIMTVKARTEPSSLYFKFIQPNAGREAIFVHGRNNNKIVAHDVGLGRVIAGTMHLDPKGDMAMEENRHPVTEAGLGAMIDTVKERWDSELRHGESVVTIHPNVKVGDRPCLMVETTHPKAGPDYLFHKVKFYVDKELGLPIRFEAYDWPKHPGAEPDLMEEYTYVNLKVNVGLKDRDFDPNNRQYSYGRF
jgi:outer membrane lipoprotein-sorting protein